MKRYNVHFVLSFHGSIEVEAQDEEHAKGLVYDKSNEELLKETLGNDEIEVIKAEEKELIKEQEEEISVQFF